MSILSIRKCPDPILRKRAEEVDSIDDEIFVLIEDMFETMYAAPGIGLAAPQVGVSKRVIVVDVEYKGSKKGNPFALINPVMLSSSGEIIAEEGCLSVPEVFGELSRAENVEVSGVDKNGNDIVVKAEGIFARAIQHEIDHIDGFLFWDRVSKVKRYTLKRKYKKLMVKS